MPHNQNLYTVAHGDASEIHVAVAFAAAHAGRANASDGRRERDARFVLRRRTILDPRIAINHALSLLDEGADIIDVGGESTRPGKKDPITQAQEIDRVLPVIEGIRKVRPDAIVSVDTYHSGTAAAAIDAGAEIVNDVSALRWDTAMSLVAMEQRPGLVLMHMRGEPEEWRHLPRIPGRGILAAGEEPACRMGGRRARSGINRDQIVLDPGFGFGKNFEENYPLLGRFHELHALGFPILSGTSRKSFIGRTLGEHGKDRRRVND